MVRTRSPLPPKLQAVLISLARDARLNVTQAVKLPYIVDVVATHVLGRPITEGTHQAWDKGVVTREMWHFLTKEEDSPIFHLEPVRFSEERKVVIDTDEEPDLTAEEQAIVDFVRDEFSRIRAGELGRLTKLMNPDILSWGTTNRRTYPDEDAYERLSEDYQGMAEEAACLTLGRLRRHSVPVEDIRDAIA